MSASLNDLTAGFSQPMQTLLDNCAQRNVIMRPYFTLRDPFTQAKFWRQSRTSEEVLKKIADLKNAGANFLAFCLDSVGPQSGDPVTNAIPGLSWHQWGEAVDCMWVVNGDAEWSTTKKINGQNGYAIYAEEAKKLNLTPGGLWKSLKDWPHVQLRSAASPLGAFTLVQIDSAMKEKYGNQ
jgi:peptidoglycan LD-endopeptidase CwlK